MADSNQSLITESTKRTKQKTKCKSEGRHSESHKKTKKQNGDRAKETAG